jgi:hypothetical protein
MGRCGRNALWLILLIMAGCGYNSFTHYQHIPQPVPGPRLAGAAAVASSVGVTYEQHVLRCTRFSVSGSDAVGNPIRVSITDWYGDGEADAIQYFDPANRDVGVFLYRGRHHFDHLRLLFGCDLDGIAPENVRPYDMGTVVLDLANRRLTLNQDNREWLCRIFSWADGVIEGAKEEDRTVFHSIRDDLYKLFRPLLR